jgi:hypothetical protein
LTSCSFAGSASSLSMMMMSFICSCRNKKYVLTTARVTYERSRFC